jgi:hypothetical protein
MVVFPVWNNIENLEQQEIRVVSKQASHDALRANEAVTTQQSSRGGHVKSWD